MMFKIYGHSDDLVEIEHLDDTGERVKENNRGDEVNCWNGGVNIVIGNAEAVEGKNAEGIRIAMRYVKGGCWEARLAPIDEDVPCPFVTTVLIERYTAVVMVVCPENTPISWKRVSSTSR
jgi:hypothetical protein